MSKYYPDDDESLLFNYDRPKVEKVLEMFGFDNVLECGGLHPYQIWAISTKQNLLFYFNARCNIYGLVTDEYYITDDYDNKCEYQTCHVNYGCLPEFDYFKFIFQAKQDDGKYYGDIDDDLVCQWIYSFLHDFKNHHA